VATKARDSLIGKACEGNARSHASPPRVVANYTTVHSARDRRSHGLRPGRRWTYRAPPESRATAFNGRRRSAAGTCRRCRHRSPPHSARATGRRVRAAYRRRRRRRPVHDTCLRCWHWGCCSRRQRCSCSCSHRSARLGADRGGADPVGEGRLLPRPNMGDGLPGAPPRCRMSRAWPDPAPAVAISQTSRAVAPRLWHFVAGVVVCVLGGYAPGSGTCAICSSGWV
jgi:hypothetical protein